MPMVAENSSRDLYIYVAPFIDHGWIIMPRYNRQTWQFAGDFKVRPQPTQERLAQDKYLAECRKERQELDPWFCFKRGIRQIITQYINSIAPS